MVTVVSPPHVARARVRVRGLAAFFVGGLALSGTYASTGVGIPCPFKALTGWDCPLCGGTRMGAALLHGDLGAAFVANPLALIALTVLALVTVTSVVEARGGPSPLRSGPLARIVASVPTWFWATLGTAIAVGFTVVRNLL